MSGTAACPEPGSAAHRRPAALTIAGSDSSGGAGIQADLKTFHRFEVYGASAITLVTAQNTIGVRAVHPLPPALVSAQIAAVAEDLVLGAVKTGALGSVAIIEAVADALAHHHLSPVVVDPVMISKHGDALLPDEAVGALTRMLIPLASLLTPNLHEAGALLGRPVDSVQRMHDAARALADLGAAAVLLKGGALPGPVALDLLYEDGDGIELPGARVDTPHTHGSGCTYGAAITALLARGRPLREAVSEAKAFMGRAIAGAAGLGRGRGPVDHWA